MAELAQPHTRDSERTSVTVDGNLLETLETGADRLKAILDLIDNARESLRVIFYIFTDDERCTLSVKEKKSTVIPSCARIGGFQIVLPDKSQ